MQHSVSFAYKGRELEIRAFVAAGDWQLWIVEAGRKIYLHSVVPFESALGPRQSGELEALLARARRDVEEEVVIVPVVRFWPSPDTEPARR
jgi:hypothetical protein